MYYTLNKEGWVAKSVARQLATAELWVRIQTSLKNHKWATYEKEWPTQSSPPKKYTKTKQKNKQKDETVIQKAMAYKCTKDKHNCCGNCTLCSSAASLAVKAFIINLRVHTV
jgi:hypothetical protein